MEKRTCPVCGDILGENVLTVFLDTKPSLVRRHSYMVDSTTFLDDPEFLVADICNNAGCLKSLLEILVHDLSKAHALMVPTRECPGAWFGPSGCEHYLREVYPTSEDAIGWYDYMHNYKASLESLSEEERAIHRLLAERWEQIEAKPATVSVIGSYYDLFDGCYHFCSPACALSLLFGEKDSQSRILAENISYAGLPSLLVPA